MDAASAASARPAEKTSDEMFRRAGAARGDHGNLDGLAHGRRQLAVEAGSRAVAVDRRQQNLAGAAIGGLRAQATASRGACVVPLRPNTRSRASPRFASIATITAWLP